jgi:predicted nucleotidyltransferase
MDEANRNPVLAKFVDDLTAALGARLRSVVLYGSAARGDFDKATSDLNLLLVMEDLDAATLEAMEPILTRWTRQGQPLPRFFSPRLIAESADVFPIEFHDIKSHGVILKGSDPFEGVTMHREHLRLQCERELREKMMRLREGYMQTHLKPKALARLLVESYSSFVALFRGCLHLMDEPVPLHNEEVVTRFCATADLDPAPFEEIARLRHGGKPADPRRLFLRYYDALHRAVQRVNRFDSQQGGRTS